MQRAWQALALGASLALGAGCSEEAKLSIPSTTQWPRQNNFPGVGPAGVIVTTDGNDDALSVIDVATHKRIFVAPIGLSPVEPEGPHHVKPSPDRKFLYVPLSNTVPGSGSGPHGAHGTGNAPGFLIKLSTEDMREVGRANLRANPGDIQITRDGSTAYVSHFNLAEAMKVLTDIGSGGTKTIADMDSYVAKVHTADMTVESIRICPAGHGMVLTPDERTLYVSCDLSDELAVIDLTTTPPTVERVKVGEGAGSPGQPLYEPYAVALSPTDGSVWISNISSSALNLTVYDPIMKKIDPTRTVNLRSAPQFGVWLADGKTLVVPAWSPDELAFIDTTTGHISSSMQMNPADCISPHQMYAMPDGKTAFLVCEGNRRDPGVLLTVDLVAQTIVDKTPLGVYPNGLTLLERAP